MREQKPYTRNPLDFRPARGHTDADLIYTTLVHYNGTRHSQYSASGLIVQAYKNYDASEPCEITKMADVATRCVSFAERFNAFSESEIMEAIKTVKIDRDITLLEPNEKHFSFYMLDPDVKDMWEKLTAVRYRDRGIIVNRFLYQYMAHGNVEFYNELCADRLMLWLKDEYDAMKDIDDSRLKRVVGMITALSNLNTKPKTDISDDEFRKLIGMDI